MNADNTLCFSSAFIGGYRSFPGSDLPTAFSFVPPFRQSAIMGTREKLGC
jgi:hypothetical protein